MKKLLCMILCLCMLISVFNITVFATDEISTFGITMSGFKGGGKKSDVIFTLSDDRLEIEKISWAGMASEEDTFVNQKNYHLTLYIKVKSGIDAKLPDSLPVDKISYTGINPAKNSTISSRGKKLRLNIEVKLSSAGEFISQAEEEALKHKHCYCGGYIEIGDHTSHKVVTYQKWPGEKSIQYTGGVARIYLDNDVELDNTFNIGGDKTVYLCLNGHSLAMKYRGQRVININVGGKLYLCNCTRSGSGQITKGNAEFGAGIHNNGTVEMYGGVVTGNEGGYGGGVYNNANFTLYGGDIYNNLALHGGGVWNDNEGEYKFIMYEGTIGLNYAKGGGGGGIYNNTYANLILKGGTINENVAGVGGGALWNNGGNVEIDGSKLLSNISMHGGGVWNNGGGIFEFKSGNVSKNIAGSSPTNIDGYGGGIWNNDNGIINMTGGEITFNTAAFGGGVWGNPNSEFMMSNGVIAENDADIGGGIYISRKGTHVATYSGPQAPARFRITNRAGVLMNIAYEKGGGAYVDGILEFEGEGEIIGNICEASYDSSDIFCAEGAQITRDEPMPTQFVDVARDAYYLDPVKWALEKGITTGTSEITFSPDDTCNTAQILTFLWRAAGQPQAKTKPLIADVYEYDYYYMAAYWAQELGIFTRALYPNFSSNRMSSVYYIWCAAGKPECKTPLKFTDTQDSKYQQYHESIAWAVENGITNGTGETTFSPGKSCSRAEIVTFLWRAASKGLI